MVSDCGSTPPEPQNTPTPQPTDTPVPPTPTPATGGGGEADLAITKDDGQTTAVPGQTVTYTVTATNNGPEDVVDATVADTMPAVLTGVTWTCAAAGGASCTANGAGDINDTVDLPVGSSLTYTVVADTDPAGNRKLTKRRATGRSSACWRKKREPKRYSPILNRRDQKTEWLNGSS